MRKRASSPSRESPDPGTPSSQVAYLLRKRLRLLSPPLTNGSQQQPQSAHHAGPTRDPEPRSATGAGVMETSPENPPLKPLKVTVDTTDNGPAQNGTVLTRSNTQRTGHPTPRSVHRHSRSAAEASAPRSMDRLASLNSSLLQQPSLQQQLPQQQQEHLSGQQAWWHPQPHATLDPEELQERPAQPLAEALSCPLCHDLLKEAITAPECGHSYCYDCIEARVPIGGKHNVCPLAGCGCVLGPNPYDHRKLQYDTLLDALVQKIFPRPLLDAALATRRAEREEATRQAKAAARGRSCSPGQEEGSGSGSEGVGGEEEEEDEEAGVTGSSSGDDVLPAAGAARRPTRRRRQQQHRRPQSASQPPQQQEGGGGAPCRRVSTRQHHHHVA